MTQQRSLAMSLAIVLTFLFASRTTAQQPAGERIRTLPPVPTGYIIEVRKADGCLFGPVVRISRQRLTASDPSVSRSPAKIGQQPAPTDGAANEEPLSPPPADSSDETSESADTVGGSIQFALPRPVRYLPDRAGGPIISHVSILARQAGELWNIRVSLGSGEFFDAGHQQLADLMLRTNERAEITGVTRFGISPLRVGIVKMIGESIINPYVTTKSRSITVGKIEAGSRLGTSTVSLRNDSSKDVLAIQYNLYKNGNFLFLKWVEGSLMRPLVKAGTVYKLDAVSDDQKCGDVDGYRQSQANRIEVSSVVFADGSYEGDPGLAALIRGQAFGNKNFLERVVAVLTELGGSGEPDPAQLIFQLKYLHDTLEETAPLYLVDALRSGLPPTDDPNADFNFRNLIRSGQHEIKSSLLGDVGLLEQMTKNQNFKALKSHSSLLLPKYKAWLAASDAIVTQ